LTIDEVTLSSHVDTLRTQDICDIQTGIEAQLFSDLDIHRAKAELGHFFSWNTWIQTGESRIRLVAQWRFERRRFCDGFPSDSQVLSCIDDFIGDYKLDATESLLVDHLKSTAPRLPVIDESRLNRDDFIDAAGQRCLRLADSILQVVFGIHFLDEADVSDA